MTRKLFETKSWGVGSTIEFGDRENYEQVTRRGTVWSMGGPVASSLWVVEDGTGEVFAVKVRTDRTTKAKAGEVLTGYPSTWQQDTLLRCNNLRTRGSVFEAVIEREERATWGSGTYTAKYPVWHADPACPDIKGERGQTQPTGFVIDILLGKVQLNVLPPFCQRCVYLVEPGVEEVA